MSNKQQNNDRRNSRKSICLTIGASNHTEEAREEHDYYATEPWAVELLLAEEEFASIIWECACGEGHLAKVLQKYGHHVISTDLIDRGFGIKEPLNFLESTAKGFYGDIITNPPYKYAAEFVEKAIEIVQEGQKVAMFLKLTFLESQKRRKLFEKYPPKVVYVSSSRLNCAKNGDFEKYPFNNAVCYAWFVWEKGFKDEPIIRWIN